MRNAADRLNAAGSERPLFEAELLLAHVMGVSRGELIALWPPYADACVIEAWEELIDRRASRVPIAYLSGYRQFYGRRMKVTPDVLVPRPETELLVERALALVRNKSAAVVIDVCTGSGCVAAAIAHECPICRVFASDVSLPALRVAAGNLRGTTGAIVAADLLTAFATSCADVITANPPYIATAEIASLEPEVRDHEPRLAVDGGSDGLTLIRPLALQALRTLRPGGTLLMEVGLHQADAVERVLTETGFAAVAAHDDLAGIPRMVEAHRPHEL